MGFTIEDLGQYAKVVVALTALTTVLAPLLGRLAFLRGLQFGYSAALTALAELASCCTFLLVLYSRNSLHHAPPFWLALVVFFLASLLLLLIHARYSTAKPEVLQSAKVLPAILLLYVGAACGLSAGFTQFAASELIFRRIHGDVRSVSNALGAVSVYCIVGSAVLHTQTNSAGHYQFLLTENEAERASELRIGDDVRSDDNFRFISWPDKSLPFRLDMNLE